MVSLAGGNKWVTSPTTRTEKKMAVLASYDY